MALKRDCRRGGLGACRVAWDGTGWSGVEWSCLLGWGGMESRAGAGDDVLRFCDGGIVIVDGGGGEGRKEA